MLGPERTRDSRSFYQSTQLPSSGESGYSSTIISALGDITNQLCHVQASISSMDKKVEDLSVKTVNLTKRVAGLEEATKQQPAKKRKVHVPLELSVSVFCCGDYFLILFFCEIDHCTTLV